MTNETGGRMTPVRRWIALIVLLAGAFLPPVDFFIVNVTLPSIHASLSPSAAELQLVISGYAACYATFLITGGRLGDLFGRKRMFVIGMTAFTAANLACGLAGSPVQLLLGRVAQGVSAAMLLSWLGERHGNDALVAAGKRIEAAVEEAIADPATRTPDLGGLLGTKAFAEIVAEKVRA